MSFPIVLDLFAGCGGLSLGFSRTGFKVYGADKNPRVAEIFELNQIGKAVQIDLSVEYMNINCDILIGGPPCRPWSAVNLRKRGKKHPDAGLVDKFITHVLFLLPRIFILENVPPARQYIFQMLKNCMIERIYNTDFRVLCYGDWGAPTKRQRLFVFGVRKDIFWPMDKLFKALFARKKKAMTVRQAFEKISGLNSDPEHVFPRPRTIHRYLHYYKTGKYGWYILKWDEPAPSFGNVMKTYILHPDSFNGGTTRVISVREALLVMGFSPEFRFPEGMGLMQRYQMIADAVSPIFSKELAESVLEVFF